MRLDMKARALRGDCLLDGEREIAVLFTIERFKDEFRQAGFRDCKIKIG